MRWTNGAVPASGCSVVHSFFPSATFPTVAVGRAGCYVEAPGCAFPHAPKDLLALVGRVEFIQDLNDTLQESAGGGVLEGFVDGDHADAMLL
jgi:hypothetical protein